MKIKFYALLVLVLALGMIISACSDKTLQIAAVSNPVEEAVAEPVEEAADDPIEEPAAEPIEETVSEASDESQAETAAEVMPATEAEMDAAFKVFLDNMVKYNTIGLNSLNEQLAADPPPFLLDVRQIEELEEKGHIEGAVNIPLRELGQHLNLLPSFDTPIVSYCGSGWRCTIAMTELGALGWENVLSLKEGSFGGWVEAGYPVTEGLAAEAMALDTAEPNPGFVSVVDEALSEIPEGWGVITADSLTTELVENPDLIVIDVRRQEEVDQQGYIEADNYLHIPLEEFIAREAEWPADKSTPIVIYCGSGHRSTMAMSILWIYGYDNIRSLKDGFGGWVEAGYPVVGGEATLDEAFQTFLADMVKYNAIGLDTLNEQLAGDPPPFLLDVRQPEELEENGHIEGAVNIPLRDLFKHVDELPSTETPIVSYCGSGWRCTIAMTALGALGWEDVLSLKDGSYGGWIVAGYPTIDGLTVEAMILDAAEPDPTLLAIMDKTISNIPEGWGVIAADELAADLIENPDLVVIDVRTPEEIDEQGVIESDNLLTIPLEELVERKAEWPAEKSTPLVVYCGSGHRSTIGMTILWSYSYEDVRSLKGGFGEWAEAGFPVVELEAVQS